VHWAAGRPVRARAMQIRVGYELNYECPQPTPMMLVLSIHFSRVSDIVVPDHLVTRPAIPVTAYRDGFGNWCSRIVAPPGQLRLTATGIVNDIGAPDLVDRQAQQHAIQDLPEECLVYLLCSRYCETDRLADIAWSLFSSAPAGWGRVQAICDFVHRHIAFAYEPGRAKSAWEAYNEGRGVCRDYAHLAIALCRCMNIPARYCTGYLSDIGVPPPHATMDFAAWFEAFIGGRWQLFDPRNNVPLIGRVLIARGRDAADVAIVTSFGRNTLTSFRVWTDEVIPAANGETMGSACAF
jgi:transglutaminase-like putative cysteine protease